MTKTNLTMSKQVVTTTTTLYNTNENIVRPKKNSLIIVITQTILPYTHPHTRSTQEAHLYNYLSRYSLESCTGVM